MPKEEAYNGIKELVENNPNTKTMLRRRVEAIDGEIDRIIYKLYDLTEDEIKVVEG